MKVKNESIVSSNYLVHQVDRILTFPVTVRRIRLSSFNIRNFKKTGVNDAAEPQRNIQRQDNQAN